MAGWGLPDEGTMVSQSRKRMSVGCWRVVFRWERWKRMTVVDGEENIEGLGSSELEENWEEEGFFLFFGYMRRRRFEQVLRVWERITTWKWKTILHSVFIFIWIQTYNNAFTKAPTDRYPYKSCFCFFNENFFMQSWVLKTRD